MTTPCTRCKVWKDDTEYTYRTKDGYFYTYCDKCRDKLEQYRDDNVKEAIKELRKSQTITINCNCGKSIKVHGNSDYYIKRHLGSNYHKNHS